MTHPEMRDALAELGIDFSPTSGCPSSGGWCSTRGRRDRGARLSADGDLLEPPVRDAGRRFRREHYHLGKDLRYVEQTAEGITARFADGTSQTADVLVGADGFRSAVRAQLLPQAQPLYAGYVAWRGLADERSLAPSCRATSSPASRSVCRRASSSWAIRSRGRATTCARAT